MRLTSTGTWVSKPGDCVLQEDGDRLRIVQAAPRILISAELLEEIEAGRLPRRMAGLMEIPFHHLTLHEEITCRLQREFPAIADTLRSDDVIYIVKQAGGYITTPDHHPTNESEGNPMPARTTLNISADAGHLIAALEIIAKHASACAAELRALDEPGALQAPMTETSP